MQSKRSELIPVGEALADLGGPVQTLRETLPPARRGQRRRRNEQIRLHVRP